MTMSGTGLIAAIGLISLAQAEPTVYRGATVLSAGPAGTIEGADLVVTAGKITRVGKQGTVPVPPDAKIVDLAGHVVIPGLVDTHSHIGISPRPSIEAHSDGNESTGPAQPGLRALDAIWPGDPGFRMALAGGVTTANIMPGSGNAIGGQTLYVKLRKGASTLAEMMIEPGRPTGGLKMANGENPKRAYGSKNQAPVTRMKLAAIQREQFVKATDYRNKRRAWEQARVAGKESSEPDRDLGLETLGEVLDGKRTVHFHSHRADDIMTVLRLKDEFGFKLVIQHGTEAFKVADEIARRGVGVSMTVIDSPGGKAEVADLTLDAGALLEKAGIKIAVNTDDGITESRFLLRTAGLTLQGGLSAETALKALTLWPAEMLDLQSRVGSLEPGKDADFVVLSGSPFSVTTHVIATYVEGVKRYDRQTDVHDAIGGFDVSDPARRPKAPPRPPAREAPRLPANVPAVDPSALPAAPRLAIRAGVAHTATGPAIRDAVILVDQGRIAAMGRAGAIQVPEGTPTIAAAAVSPGLIDAHTVVGVAGLFNVAADQDQDETSDPNQADLRILDSYNPEEPLLRFALEHGVTVVQAFPGRVNVIAGQAGIFRTHGKTAAAMTIRFPSALVFNLGEIPKRAYDGKAPRTRMATAALIRNAFVAARNDTAKRSHSKPDSPPPDRNLKFEAIQLVLDRKIPAILAAHRADDLETALRIAEEFRLDAQLDLASEAYLIADRIAAAKVPVLVHPTMQRVGSPETYRCTTRNASLLAEQGIPIAITSAFEGYVPKTRVPLYEAAMAMRDGLDPEAAMRSITIDPAKILKIDRDYGSIEPGKVADLVLYDGDPFEYATRITYVIMNGQVVHDRRTPRQGRAGGGPAAVGEDCCLEGF